MKLSRKLALGVAAGAISVMALAGAAFAHPGGGDSTAKDSFLDKLAQKLGIERTTLDDAVKQVQTEVAAEQLDVLLAQAVTDGRITQAQADEIKTWVNARPASADKVPGLMQPGAGGFGPHGFGSGHHGFRGHGRGHGGFGAYPRMAPAEALSARLDALVTAGTITQAEADEIKAWVDARPDSLDLLRGMGHFAPSESGESSGTSSPTSLQAILGIPA